MATFTRNEVVARARELYGAPVCIDMLDDAMHEETVDSAAELLVVDSAYWDSADGFTLTIPKGR